MVEIGTTKGKKTLDTRIVIHHNALSLRGDSVNAENLSTLLHKFYGIPSLVVAPNSAQNSSTRILELKDSGVNVRIYNDMNHLWHLASKFRASHSYFLTDGSASKLRIPGTRHLTHAVFQNFSPSGDVYAYVSEWLYRRCVARNLLSRFSEGLDSDNQQMLDYPNKEEQTFITWVPHTVVKKEFSPGSFRKKYNIGKNVKIISRIGGFHQFDDPAAQAAVIDLATKNSGILFVLVNTKPFFNHKNILYFNSHPDKMGLSTDDKWRLYADSVLSLNARTTGETFGYSIVEPLILGKPVIAPDQLRFPRMDANHMHILRPLGLTYFHKRDLVSKVERIIESPLDADLLRQSVAEYSPEMSMELFVRRFLF